MSIDMLERLHVAGEALNRGDPEPLASLFAEDAEWRGVPRRVLLWKVAPRCHGPEEAREVLAHQVRKRGGRLVEAPPAFTWVGPGTVVGSLEWTNDDGTSARRFHVLKVAGGRIVAMRCFACRSDAERVAKGLLVPSPAQP